MSASLSALVHRYCRAQKRGMDRADRILSNPIGGVKALEADEVLRFRRRETQKHLSKLPDSIRRNVRG